MHASFWTLLSFTISAFVHTTPSLAGVIRRAEIDANVAGKVTCAPVANITGKLVMRGSPLSSSVPLAMTDVRGLAEVSDAAQSVSVVFEDCRSVAMEYFSDPAKGLYYGHLKLAEDQTRCLRSDPRFNSERDDPQAITLAPCTLEDDNFQFYQFWSVALNLTDATVPARVDFIGLPSDNETPIHFITEFRGEKGSRVANVLGVFGPVNETFALSLVQSSE